MIFMSFSKRSLVAMSEAALIEAGGGLAAWYSSQLDRADAWTASGTDTTPRACSYQSWHALRRLRQLKQKEEFSVYNV